MELLGLADIYLLRLFNVPFVFWTYKTLKSNFAEGKSISF
jgi:hypothetical protein